MKPLPEPDDPWALQARIMSAVCNDIMDGGNRFQAMREIRKQASREAGGSNKAPASNNGD